MIDKQQPVRVERGGDFKEQQFRISDENVAHILGILRNQLYSDKVLAVVREYVCNALDAHVEAKQDKPIVVGAPTAFQPMFTVRDFGPGMSPDTVFGLFTSYGDSTKRLSNGYVGMYGIGSKSAFAYTDSFNVISYYEGVKYTYVCYIDESHRGKVALMNEEPSDEPTGLEINVPVKAADCQTFAQKIQWIYYWAQSPFQVVGLQVEDTPLNPYFEGERWALLNTKGLPTAVAQYFPRAGTHLVVMGHVAYPFTAADLPQTAECNVWKDLLQGLNVICRVEIGDIDINASRERPQFTKRTVGAITDILRVMVESLSQRVVDEIKDAQGFLHACSIWASPKYDYLRGVLNLSSRLKLATDFQGRPLVMEISDKLRREMLGNAALRRFYLSGGRLYEERPSRWNKVTAVNFKEPLCVAKESTSKILLRIRQHILDTGMQKANSWERAILQVLIIPDDLYPAALEQLQGVKYQELDLVEPPKTTSQAKADSRFNPLVACYEWDWKKEEWVETEAQFQVGEQQVYVPLNRFYVIREKCSLFRWSNGARMEPPGRVTTDFKNIVQKIIRPLMNSRGVKLESVRILGIKAAHLDKLEGDWIPADKWVVQEICQLLEDKPQLTTRLSMAFSGDFGHVSLNQSLPLYKYLPETHRLHSLTKYVEEIRKVRQNYEWLWLAMTEGVPSLKKYIPPQKAVEIWKEAAKLYPLLTALIWQYNHNGLDRDRFAKHMALYIKTIDQAIERRLSQTSKQPEVQEVEEPSFLPVLDTKDLEELDGKKFVLTE